MAVYFQRSSASPPNVCGPLASTNAIRHDGLRKHKCQLRPLAWCPSQSHYQSYNGRIPGLPHATPHVRDPMPLFPSHSAEYIPHVNSSYGTNYLRQLLVPLPRRSTLHHSGALVLAGAHRAAPAVRERRAVFWRTDTAPGQRTPNPD
jgi:hypothetical protein